MKPYVTEAWPQFTADAQFTASFGQVRVERAVQNNRQRTVTLCLRSAAPLDAALCGRLCASLQPEFGKYALRVENYFDYTAITAAAAAVLVGELKALGCPVKGFLREPDPVEVTPDGLTLYVAAGRELVEECDVAGRLAALVEARTGVRPAVRLADAAPSKRGAEEGDEAPFAAPAPPPRFAARPKTTVKPFTIPGLDLTRRRRASSAARRSRPATCARCTIWATAAR